MSDQRVLRVPRSDVEGDSSSFVLVHVVNNGNQPLDVRLIGTEGDSPYVGTVKQRQITKLRATNYSGSPEEWHAILASALLQQHPPPSDPEREKAVEGLELVASVTPGERLSIVVRKNIGGITHRLGTVNLNVDEDEEIALFQWAGLAAQAAVASRREAADLTARMAAQHATIDKLHAQLEDLIRAKKEHEDAMLDKFQRLLNSKKAKIRDQQRLLDGAGLGPTSAAEAAGGDDGAQEKSSRRTTASRKAGASRRSKRKAKEAVQEEEDDDDPLKAEQAEEAEQMDFEDVVPETASPDKDEDAETTDESEDNDDDDDDGGGANKPATRRQQPKEAVEPLPRRELPFAKRGPIAEKPKPKQGQSASKDEADTDDEDDEL